MSTWDGLSRKAIVSEMKMTLGNPFLIGIYSAALLSIGAAIDARWGHSAHAAIWMVLIGAGLMVVHDMLTGLIFFFASIAWASRNRYPRDLNTTPTQASIEQVKPTRNLKSRSKAHARETD